MDDIYQNRGADQIRQINQHRKHSFYSSSSAMGLPELAIGLVEGVVKFS